jgi:hypothetical protein
MTSELDALYLEAMSEDSHLLTFPPNQVQLLFLSSLAKRSRIALVVYPCSPTLVGSSITNLSNATWEATPDYLRCRGKRQGNRGPMAAALVPCVKLVKPRYGGSTEHLPHHNNRERSVKFYRTSDPVLETIQTHAQYLPECLWATPSQIRPQGYFSPRAGRRLPRAFGGSILVSSSS